jgi:CBS domain-containing protein
MLVKEIMTKNVITVSPDASLKEVGIIFKEKRISGVPVVDKNNTIVGIVTLTDMLRILDQIYIWKELEKLVPGCKLSEMEQEEKAKAKARDIMTKEVYTINEQGTIDDLMKMMFTKKIHSIPVTREGKLVGIVGKRDVIYACF